MQVGSSSWLKFLILLLSLLFTFNTPQIDSNIHVRFVVLGQTDSISW